jgi:hypothetical protein
MQNKKWDISISAVISLGQPLERQMCSGSFLLEELKWEVYVILRGALTTTGLIVP